MRSAVRARVYSSRPAPHPTRCSIHRSVSHRLLYLEPRAGRLRGMRKTSLPGLFGSCSPSHNRLLKGQGRLVCSQGSHARKGEARATPGSVCSMFSTRTRGQTRSVRRKDRARQNVEQIEIAVNHSVLVGIAPGVTEPGGRAHMCRRGPDVCADRRLKRIPSQNRTAGHEGDQAVQSASCHGRTVYENAARGQSAS